MAGVQALHDRFGRLPLRPFGPAKWVAMRVAVGPMVANLLGPRTVRHAVTGGRADFCEEGRRPV